MKIKKTIPILIAVFLTMGLSAGCKGTSRTEIISATIEKNIATGDIWQTIEGYRPARIDFIIYNFGNIPSVEDSKDCSQVTKWFVDYTHCYQNGQEIERSYYYYHDDEFKKEKKCKITVFYQIPDDGKFEDLRFVFGLDGFEISYDGEFINNVD
jgi:hypothetical protein